MQENKIKVIIFTTLGLQKHNFMCHTTEHNITNNSIGGKNKNGDNILLLDLKSFKHTSLIHLLQINGFQENDVSSVTIVHPTEWDYVLFRVTSKIIKESSLALNINIILSSHWINQGRLINNLTQEFKDATILLCKKEKMMGYSILM